MRSLESFMVNVIINNKMQLIELNRLYGYNFNICVYSAKGIEEAILSMVIDSEFSVCLSDEILGRLNEEELSVLVLREILFQHCLLSEGNISEQDRVFIYRILIGEYGYGNVLRALISVCDKDIAIVQDFVNVRDTIGVKINISEIEKQVIGGMVCVN